MKRLGFVIVGILVAGGLFFGIQKVREMSQQPQIPASRLATVTLPVSGMTCSGCSKTIETGLSKIDGVQNAKADHVAQNVTVQYDIEAVNKEGIIKTLESLGYTVVIKESVQKKGKKDAGKKRGLEVLDYNISFQ